MSDGAKRDLSGLVAVVTGAAQGLGLGIARELGGRGAEVIAADLQLDKAEAECEQMTADGIAARAAQLNITDSAAV
ncbi:MAG: SDR family NAD(P)-dependent oxidoreductase, partial [Candidatus Latescibacterota bacterium]|nr:SDR family NAD(P)-dependent oxidoreductase [Candidatus Latescibacterota bacterium]